MTSSKYIFQLVPFQLKVDSMLPNLSLDMKFLGNVFAGDGTSCSNK